MDNENKNVQTDAKDCAKLIGDIKKDSRLYGYISVAMQSYIDGLKAAMNCQRHAQINN